jgi:hypothetical protein
MPAALAAHISGQHGGKRFIAGNKWKQVIVVTNDNRSHLQLQLFSGKISGWNWRKPNAPAGSASQRGP